VRSDECASTLVLFPAAVLILLALAGMAVDGATLFLSQRRMVDLSTAVAHDAIAGIDHAAFYGEGAVVVEPGRARTRQQQLVASVEEHWSLDSVSCSLTTAADTATAICSATVRPILAPLWWGDGARDRRVEAIEMARGEQS
jgi:hypothetical protein